MNSLPPPSPRQTVSYLRNLFEERGLHPKSKLGQNFLIDLNLIEVLLRAAELTPDDLVLEVGSGTGSLTARLVAQAGGVVSVEVDPDFAEMADEAVTVHRDRVALLHTDVLKNKNELNPAVLQAVHDLKQITRTVTVKLVANLPYSVATPVIANLLLSELEIERMVVTVQWEIAERLMASPGVKDYGALAVLVQSIANVTLVRKLPPSVFWPRPLVDSAIVKIMPDRAKRALVGDVLKFRTFLRDLYSHRRKNLRGGLVSMAGRGLSKQDVDARLAALGVDGKVRAETLDLQQHLALSNVFG
jgi:16S rRNA (adenine1518-N6/adenine1519-N6)-dimethyltransferase